MARAYGARAQLLAKFETTYGAAPTGNYDKLPFVSSGLGAAQNLIESDLIGQGREPLIASRDVIDVDGDIVVPVDLRNIGQWLKALLGAPVTTGTGPFTHTYVSGAPALPSLAIEVGFPEVPAFLTMTGCLLDRMALSFQRAGHANATLGLIGQKETRAGTTGGGTPTERVLTRFNQFQGSIRKDAAALANVTEATLDFANGLERVPAIRADGLIEAVEPSICKLAGRIVTRFADTTLLAAAEAGTAMELELAYAIDASNKLTLTAHEVLLPKPKTTVEGPGGVEATFDWQGAKDPGLAKMLTVALVNDVAAY